MVLLAPSTLTHTWTLHVQYPGTCGKIFNRELKNDPSMQNAYSQLVGQQKKQEFRAQWAQQKLEEAQRTCEKIQSHIQEESVVGTYLPFRRIWDMEGGDQAGLEAT